MKTKKVVRKALDIKESGRSSDYISPSFIYECGFNCAYCYVKRHNGKYITIAKNNGDLLSAINDHVAWLPEKEPNQTHPLYYTYDIGCNSDIGLHYKQINWKYIFDFFKMHPRVMGTFATKTVTNEFLNYNPDGKIRIRFSLMPENIRQILEPKTSNIEERLYAVRLFQDAGYDVHLNFSPVIYYDKWLQDYKELFNQVKDIAHRDHWDLGNPVKAEVIFLTHNESKHFKNLENNLKGEDLLWSNSIQESKISQYGGKNVRYKHKLKNEWINEWRALHDRVIPWNTIRYIF